MFSLICVWINGWVNNREAGDLRRHRAHYDVNVMHCSDNGISPIRHRNVSTLIYHPMHSHAKSAKWNLCVSWTLDISKHIFDTATACVQTEQNMLNGIQKLVFKLSWRHSLAPCFLKWCFIIFNKRNPQNSLFGLITEIIIETSSLVATRQISMWGGKSNHSRTSPVLYITVAL